MAKSAISISRSIVGNPVGAYLRENECKIRLIKTVAKFDNGEIEERHVFEITPLKVATECFACAIRDILGEEGTLIGKDRSKLLIACIYSQRVVLCPETQDLTEKEQRNIFDFLKRRIETISE